MLPRALQRLTQLEDENAKARHWSGNRKQPFRFALIPEPG